mmetsp:Transcript_6432/g.19515  ORF Transcript_6432/g.19515 Transcript_6432/m.19515 type:complete len:369 (-) Transcript_6432:254-1360(-)
MAISEYVRANLAQAMVNMLFGAASVVSSLGLHEFNAVVFGLIRAVLTTVLLVVMRWEQRLLCGSKLRVRKEDVARFVAAGFCLFVGEYFYILGVELAGSIRASLWQPSQPIWTMAITAILGHERMSWKKGFGVACAFAGCAIMVLGRADGGGSRHSSLVALLGNVCLFINCSLGTPLYIIAVKPLLDEYPPFAVAGLTFAINSVCFGVALSFMPLLVDPATLIPPLESLTWASVIYVAVFATVLPYVLQLWATRLLPASLVSAYYVLQPVAAAALVYTLLALHLASSLQTGQLSDLGSIAVLAGLVVIIRETPPDDHVPDDECRLNGDYGDPCGSPTAYPSGLRRTANSPRHPDHDTTKLTKPDDPIV